MEMCWGRQTFCMGHTCGLVGFSGALLSGVLRSGCWNFTSKVWFFAEDISSPFRAIVPNVCLLSTFSGKERERQRVGNDHRASLAACCGWKKNSFRLKRKKNCVRCNGISGEAWPSWWHRPGCFLSQRRSCSVRNLPVPPSSPC